MDRTAAGHAAVQRELNRERAAALGRIGRHLEALLSRLDTLHARWAAAQGAERDALAQAHAECRREARQYRWYLEVQRESVGLRHHHDLDALYPVPPALAP